MNLALMQLLLAVGTQPGRVTAPSLLHIALPILFRMAYLFFGLVTCQTNASGRTPVQVISALAP